MPDTPAPLRECSKCGRCCTGFVIHMDTCGEDMKIYFAAHGCYEIKLYANKTSVFIPQRCLYLTPDGLCAIHDSPIRPEACKKGPIPGENWIPKGCTAVDTSAPPRES
jgi:hypothetical protein